MDADLSASFFFLPFDEQMLNEIMPLLKKHATTSNNEDYCEHEFWEIFFIFALKSLCVSVLESLGHWWALGS
jgi:hypothetical protein